MFKNPLDVAYSISIFYDFILINFSKYFTPEPITFLICGFFVTMSENSVDFPNVVQISLAN